ncbi:FAD-dependent monooxygenase [Dichotomicrobium thermohalophilum]|uniref:Salicylate hydroxylase n=1 Tax=Dichotomicrobium thermohalophilum TaxID=933063 RepID=A0A397Q1Q4_9HYPH|nr:FAD-dependent monooxygenase [Dichotomicrobium thermohalophilum]RIA55316.1 salicylate hydroxylase [Dichotomicrobium thermohalophilum]
MLSDDKRRILIAGGGIGGLSAALALAQSGTPVQVLEQAAAFSEAGAGIQLGPNGVHVLRALGVADALAPCAVTPEGVHLVDARAGQCLTTVPLGPLAEMRYGAPYWVVHRADLQRVLLDAVRATDNVAITQPFRVASCAEEGQRVQVTSDAGDTVAGGALIGADGIRSIVRSQIGAAGEPVHSGKSAWRLTVPLDEAAAPMQQNAIGLWLSPGAHMVHYPVRGGAEVNIVVIVEDRDAPEGWNVPGAAEEFLPHLDGWPENITGFLAGQTGWRRWALYDMPPPGQWSAGRIALLGDAAHPVLPFLASGGVLAIEDAAALARSLAFAKGQTEAAFAAYARQRRPRAARVQARSRRMGRIYHMSGVMRWSRNQVLTMQRPHELLRRNDWLYSYRADEA